MRVARGADAAFRSLPGRRSADPVPGLGAGFSVRVVELEGGTPRTPHRHPQSLELIYVAEGAGRVWEEGVWAAVEAGDWVVVEQGRAHATVPPPGGRMRLVCFFPHPNLEENLEELDGSIEGGV